MSSRFDFPPHELANRVGSLTDADFRRQYHDIGASLHGVVVDSLPVGWSWEGKRVLDFGCGAGRALRHFHTEARADGAEFWGCDIDGTSIDWVNAHLAPPFRGFVNGARPPLAQPDDRFDLVYALSVFTHLSDEWSSWLVEMHRILRPGGLLVATFLGEGMSQIHAEEPWVEDRIGMNVLRPDAPWEEGGPTVLMSPWWIEEHWGRAFDIVSLQPGTTHGRHGLVVLTPKPGPVTREALERIHPAEPRETGALRHNLAQLRREAVSQRARYEDSVSWRLTAPLRGMAARVRRRYPGLGTRSAR